MSIILIIVANPEKLHVRLMRYCMTMRRRSAIRVTQICILMAFELSLWKYLRGSWDCTAHNAKKRSASEMLETERYMIYLLYFLL